MPVLRMLKEWKKNRCQTKGNDLLASKHVMEKEVRAVFFLAIRDKEFQCSVCHTYFGRNNRREGEGKASSLVSPHKT